MDIPQGAPNDSAPAVDSTHQEAPPRESTFGASEDFDSFRETPRVSPPDSIQLSQPASEAQETQTRSLSVPEEFSAKEENGQQPQQQASAGADCSVQAPHFESERDDDQTKAEETQGPQDEASEGGCP